MEKNQLDKKCPVCGLTHRARDSVVCPICRSSMTCRVCRDLHQGEICSRVLEKGWLYAYGDSPLLHLTEAELVEMSTTTDLYGVELEAYAPPEEREEKVGEIYSSVGRKVMIKSDGSLDDDRGLEIVTVPMTLKEQRATWQKLFNDVKGLTSWRHGTCGIHVHIGTYGLTALEKAKILVFVNRVSNGEFLSALAGREVSRHARWCKQKNYKIQRPTRYNCHHYDAAAIAKKGKTIEVRIWRGNATPHGVVRAVEFCDALKNFVKETPLKKLGWRHFVKWLLVKKDHKSRYRELFRQVAAWDLERRRAEKEKRLAKKMLKNQQVVKEEVQNVCHTVRAA